MMSAHAVPRLQRLTSQLGASAAAHAPPRALSTAVAAATGSIEHPSDPYPGPSAPGKITVYGQPTSRVCKVLWLCKEIGLEYDQVSGMDRNKTRSDI